MLLCHLSPNKPEIILGKNVLYFLSYIHFFFIFRGIKTKDLLFYENAYNIINWKKMKIYFFRIYESINQLL